MKQSEFWSVSDAVVSRSNMTNGENSCFTLVCEDPSSNHVSTLTRSPAPMPLEQRNKRSPAPGKTLWSLNNSLKADKTAAVIWESTHGCVSLPSMQQTPNKESISLWCPPRSPPIFSPILQAPRCFWHHSSARFAFCYHEWKEEHDS